MTMRIVTAVGVLALFTFGVAAQRLEPPKLEPSPSTESQKQLIREGVALHDRGDFDGAIARYEQVLKENPNNVLALYEMSYSYYARKDYQKSLDMGLNAVRYKSNLIEMKKQGHLEAFVYYINQRSTIAGVNEWLSQNQNKVADFLAWSKGYSWPKMD